MTILGIETSCDETSAAVVKDGVLLSNVTATQYFHSQYGGVVPELASRSHQQRIVPIVEEALGRAGVSKEELHTVAAVYGPGLVGAILVGLSFGKAMALGLGIPFIGVNHMEAHIFSNLIKEPFPQFPYINLTISGGHTELVLVRKQFDYTMLGTTMDDAAGEAFDKVAKMLGLGYPGGPAVDACARLGNPQAVNFPRPYLREGSYEFSFSGLKTSVLYYLRKQQYSPQHLEEKKSFVQDVCASFQSAVVDVLVAKTIQAAKEYAVPHIAVAGGVAANSALREALYKAAIEHRRSLFIPEFEFCTDNGAMVAMVGYRKMLLGKTSNLELTAEPGLELGI